MEQEYPVGWEIHKKLDKYDELCYNTLGIRKDSRRALPDTVRF